MTRAVDPVVVAPDVPAGEAPAAQERPAPGAELAVGVNRAVPRWVRVVTVAAVSVVAAVAAVVSYVHMRELGIRAGEGWRADIIPLSADGLLVAASMVMLVRRRAGERTGALPWLGLVLGLVASLAANLAVADWDNPVSLAVSGWPPLALAVAFELLILVTRDASRGPGAVSGEDETGLSSMETPDQLGADQLKPAEAGEVAALEHQARQLLVEIRQLTQAADQPGGRLGGRGATNQVNSRSSSHA